MLAWGWRLPFILGFVLAPVGLYVRSRVSESPAFERTRQQQGVARNPFKDALTTQRLPVLAAFGLAAVGTVGNYTFNIYMPTYATRQLAIAPGTAFWSGTTAAIATPQPLPPTPPQRAAPRAHGGPARAPMPPARPAALPPVAPARTAARYPGGP